MSDGLRRYRLMKGDWPHPDSPAGRALSYHDYLKKERVLRAKNVMQALWFAKTTLVSAVQQETGEALDDGLSGILPGILTALVTVAGTTLVGFSIGSLGGAIVGVGVGAVPGAIAGGSIGFSAGMWILEWMGLGCLAEHVGKNMYQVGRLMEQGFNEAWGWGGRNWSSLRPPSDMMPCHHTNIPDFSRTIAASEKFARAVAVLIRIVLEGVVLYLTTRGVSTLPELTGLLKNSRLGEGFASWVQKNHSTLMVNPKLTRGVGAGGVAGQISLKDHTGMPLQPVQQKRPLPRKEVRSAGEGIPIKVTSSPFLKPRLRKTVLEPGAVPGPVSPTINAMPDIPKGFPMISRSEVNTFSKTPSAETLTEGTKLYRVVGADNNPAGAFWTRNLPTTEAEWRSSAAVQGQWNGDGGYVEYTVPPGGIPAWTGEAAPQPAALPGYILKGGGDQVVVPPNSITPSAPKPTPWNRQP